MTNFLDLPLDVFDYIKAKERETLRLREEAGRHRSEGFNDGFYFHHYALWTLLGCGWGQHRFSNGSGSVVDSEDATQIATCERCGLVKRMNLKESEVSAAWAACKRKR